MHVQDINEYMDFISMKAVVVAFSDLFLYFFQILALKHLSYETLDNDYSFLSFSALIC